MKKDREWVNALLRRQEDDRPSRLRQSPLDMERLSSLFKFPTPDSLIQTGEGVLVNGQIGMGKTNFTRLLNDYRSRALLKAEVEFFPADQLEKEAPLRSEIVLPSPAVSILLSLRAKKIALNDLTWRQFEEIIAEMLEAEGYSVQLQQGKKDGGKDIIARLHLPSIGDILSIWQVKHYRNRKVGLETVRELADVRLELGAHKAFVVTSSFLTRGALARIEREKNFLSKKDHDDLWQWIDGTKLD